MRGRYGGDAWEIHREMRGDRTLSESSAEASEVRCISGTELSARSWKEASEKRRKHLPGCCRPARPARCRAAAWETGGQGRVGGG